MRLYVSSVGGDIAQSIVGIISRNIVSTYIVGTDLTPENSGKAIVDFLSKMYYVKSSFYLKIATNSLLQNHKISMHPVS